MISASLHVLYFLLSEYWSLKNLIAKLCQKNFSRIYSPKLFSSRLYIEVTQKKNSIPCHCEGFTDAKSGQFKHSEHRSVNIVILTFSAGPRSSKQRWVVPYCVTLPFTSITSLPITVCFLLKSFPDKNRRLQPSSQLSLIALFAAYKKCTWRTTWGLTEGFVTCSALMQVYSSSLLMPVIQVKARLWHQPRTTL